MQESIIKAEVLKIFLSDHASMAIMFIQGTETSSGLWKFSNSLLQDENFVKEL